MTICLAVERVPLKFPPRVEALCGVEPDALAGDFHRVTCAACIERGVRDLHIKAA